MLYIPLHANAQVYSRETKELNKKELILEEKKEKKPELTSLLNSTIDNFMRKTDYHSSIGLKFLKHHIEDMYIFLNENRKEGIPLELEDEVREAAQRVGGDILVSMLNQTLLYDIYVKGMDRINLKMDEYTIRNRKDSFAFGPCFVLGKNSIGARTKVKLTQFDGKIEVYWNETNLNLSIPVRNNNKKIGNVGFNYNIEYGKRGAYSVVFTISR